MKQKGRLFLAGLILAFGLESAAAAGTWEDGVILPEPEVQIQTEASGEAAEAGQVGEFPAEELSGAEISEMTEIPAEPAVSEETADPGILSGEGSEEAESAGDPEIILDILPAEDVPAYAAEDFDAEAVPETEDKDAWGIQAAEEPFPGAAAVKLDRSCTGSVSPSAPENCYKFTITQTGVLNLGAKSADISRMRYAL